MAKKQMEIHETQSIAWIPVEGSPGICEKILNKDPETGSVTRLLRFDPGTSTTEVLVHDFVEEIWVIEGGLTDTRQNLELKKNSYGYRHPGMEHGPYYTKDGAITFEIRNYGKP